MAITKLTWIVTTVKTRSQLISGLRWKALTWYIKKDRYTHQNERCISITRFRFVNEFIELEQRKKIRLKVGHPADCKTFPHVFSTVKKKLIDSLRLLVLPFGPVE